LNNLPIKYNTDFLGLGYIITNVLIFALVFSSKNEALSAWKKIVKPWKEDNITVWFVESENTYDFIMNCDSGKNTDINWVFCKTLAISENYRRFKEQYLDSAVMFFGIYTPKKESGPVELFSYRKKVTNVKFIVEAQVDGRGIVSEARRTLHKEIVNE